LPLYKITHLTCLPCARPDIIRFSRTAVVQSRRNRVFAGPRSFLQSCSARGGACGPVRPARPTDGTCITIIYNVSVNWCLIIIVVSTKNLIAFVCCTFCMHFFYFIVSFYTINEQIKRLDIYRWLQTDLGLDRFTFQ